MAKRLLAHFAFAQPLGSWQDSLGFRLGFRGDDLTLAGPLSTGPRNRQGGARHAWHYPTFCFAAGHRSGLRDIGYHAAGYHHAADSPAGGLQLADQGSQLLAVDAIFRPEQNFLANTFAKLGRVWSYG